MTPTGVERLNGWICDAERAAGLGLDPFRLRSGLWDHLPLPQRLAGLEALSSEIERQIAELAAYKARLDIVEQRRVELSIALQHMRIAWIETEVRIAKQKS